VLNLQSQATSPVGTQKKGKIKIYSRTNQKLGGKNREESIM
jgi:hypothetical protein